MEDILHYVWKYKLFENLLTVGGEPIEVIDTGITNPNSGPDFFNAKIKIGEQLWSGNIEIHVSADQWYKHGHDSDQNYDSVILHVVKKSNKQVFTSKGREVAQCILKYPNHIDTNMEFLLETDTSLPCINFVSSIPKITLNSWKNTLLVERLERKTRDIKRLLEQYTNSWEEVFYVLLVRSFGFGLNSDAFERLARSISLTCIKKHADSLFQLEAILFGQAGMLNNPTDEYQTKLFEEYKFLRDKFKLQPLDESLFRTLRTRPSAFPQLRIAQLSVILHTYPNLFNKIIEAKDIGTLRLLFQVNPSEYWQTHYNFGIESSKKSKYLGVNSLDGLIINAICPTLFCYGNHIGNEDIKEKSLSFLEKIEPENNSITKEFKRGRIDIKSAFDSQAFIQLKREYCEKKKCLFCRIGHLVLANK